MKALRHITKRADAIGQEHIEMNRPLVGFSTIQAGLWSGVKPYLH